MSVNLDHLPSLRSVIDSAGLRAHKRFGQNFLLDLNLTRKIARSGGPYAGCDVVEVGPGPGGLTRALLIEGAEFIHAIELDERCCEVLLPLTNHAPNLRIYNADATKWCYEGSKPVRIVANLPYNVGTFLLTQWLEGHSLNKDVLSYTLLFQKEVAQRITAPVKTKAYGRLAVLCQVTCKCNTLFDIPPDAFLPAPKVTSTLVRLDTLPNIPDGNTLSMLGKITRFAFGQRRKMLRKSLSPMGEAALATLAELQIDEKMRAEDVTPQQFLSFARLMLKHHS